MKNGYNPRDSKYRPPTLKERDVNKTGSGKDGEGGAIDDFNYKGKVTNTQGSDYQDTGRANSGLFGNFAEKDASIAYLTGRNKEGIRVKNYSGTNSEAELRIGHGPTAYDTRPIPEVYHPATSQGSVDPNAVVYRSTVKDRNNSQPQEQDTEMDTKTKPIVKHIKSKE